MLHAVVVWQGNGSTIGLFHPFRDWSTLSGKIPDKWKTDNRFPLISWWKPATDGRTVAPAAVSFRLFSLLSFLSETITTIDFFQFQDERGKSLGMSGAFHCHDCGKIIMKHGFLCVEWSCAIFPRLFANLCLPALSGGITICSREPSQFSRSFVPSIALPS